MKRDQKYTPKYWICHYTDEDDVIFDTADKSMQGSIHKYNERYCDFYKKQESDSIGVSLFEIKFVKEK